MLKQEPIRIKQTLKCSVTKIQCIIGLIIFSLIVLLTFHDHFTFQWMLQNSSLISRTKPILSSRSATNLLLLYEQELSSRSATNLLLLYEQELSRVEKAPFRPTFHNHRLTLKLNLTSMATDLFDYFKNNSKNKIHELKITSLKSSKNVNDFHPICEIYLTFDVQILNITEVRLILLLKNMTCSLLLTNTSDMISIDMHQTFSVNDTFRFTHQWSHFDTAKLLFWPQWPITTKCLNWYLNNLTENANQFSKLNLNSFQCPLVNVLMHSTSRELYMEEQSAVSYWLDLQYNASINQTVSNRTNKSINRRRLVPFEIAKNSAVCSNEFQNWISKYQQWHENISFIINNGSTTFEEQRNRIIELDVRFLIYEKHVSGIADRIIHLISTYFVALLTNRLFIFDEKWPEFSDIMQSSLNYEQKLVIPWFSQLDLLNKKFRSNGRNYLTLKTNFFAFDRYNKDYDYEKSFPERILLFKGHTGGVIHTIQSNTSIYRKFLTIDLKMNTDEIFGCLYHSIFTYRLSELIKRVSLTSTNEQLGYSSKQILQILLSPKFFPIGIQIRVGDQAMTETKNDESNSILHDKKNIDNSMNFFTCAQDIIYKNEIIFKKTGQKSISFLLSDSRELRQAALRRWKLPFKCFQSLENECRSDNKQFYILANSDPVFHVQYAKNPTLAFQLGMFDIFLFSLCEQHIISTESGFGRFPAFASLKQRNIYSLLLGEQRSCLDEGMTLAISGHHWSGI